MASLYDVSGSRGFAPSPFIAKQMAHVFWDEDLKYPDAVMTLKKILIVLDRHSFLSYKSTLSGTAICTMLGWVSKFQTCFKRGFDSLRPLQFIFT